jgi:hypothetical protein
MDCGVSLLVASFFKIRIALREEQIQYAPDRCYRLRNNESAGFGEILVVAIHSAPLQSR